MRKLLLIVRSRDGAPSPWERILTLLRPRYIFELAARAHEEDWCEEAVTIV